MVRFNVKKSRRGPQSSYDRAEYMLGVSARRAAAVAQRRAPAVRTGAVYADGELKAITVHSSSVHDGTGAVVLLNGCARGDDISERVGRQITMKSIELKGVSYVTAGTGIDQSVRAMVVYDRQTNGSALTIAQVLDQTAGNPSYQLRNLENRRRFTVLMDRRIDLNASGESGSTKQWQFYRRLNHPVTFNSGDAGTVADITTGSVYLITVGNVAAGATAGGCLVYSRIRYDDK